MKSILKNRIVRYILACILIICATIAAIFLYGKIQYENNTKYVNDVARKLGYSDSSLVARHYRCWDINAHCGIFINYVTDKSLEEFKKDLGTLYPNLRDPDIIDGSFIFTEINMGTTRTLTVDGAEDLSDRIPDNKIPIGREWLISDANNKTLSISFYKIPFDRGVYRIDEEVITKNIVTIMLQTK